MFLEFARHEVHEYDLVACGVGCACVRLGLPWVEVCVVNHHKVDAPGERFLECGQVSPVVFAKHRYVEHVAAVAHEVFVRRMDGNCKAG